jgi:hypothetical protein
VATPNLGPAELLLIAALLGVLLLEVAYWVIRLAVRSRFSDALRASREWLERHDDRREPARG